MTEPFSVDERLEILRIELETPEPRHFHHADVAAVVAEVDRLRGALARAEAERDGVYRERAHLVAHLAALHPSHIGYTDPDVTTWPVLTVETPCGQMCWHINPADLDLFGHVAVVDPVAIGWDGHSTEEKYQRLRDLTTQERRP